MSHTPNKLLKCHLLHQDMHSNLCSKIGCCVFFFSLFMNGELGIQESVPARGECECIIIIHEDKSSARNNWIIWEAVDLRIV